MKSRRLVLLLGLVGIAAASAIRALPDRAGSFPHLEHDGLFPTCIACHRGVESGVEAELYPAAAECARCHDGERLERVEWGGGRTAVSNVRFSHPEHARELERAGEAAGCATCHESEAARSHMDVGGPRPEACIGCHAHRAPEHLAGSADCTACHRPLAEARGLGTDRIRDLPRPPDHGEPGFATDHDPGGAGTAVGGVAKCALCHARPSCERCHANAGSVAAIQALPEDARVAAAVEGKPAAYARPADHADGRWDWRHAESARATVDGCANCHTRPSCLGCHEGGETPAIAALPEPVGTATGVAAPVATTRVHASGFRTGHRAQASALDNCSSCHAQAFCTDCHDAGASPSFHLPNFVELHGASAFGAETECASCHNTEMFCRDCHAATGRTTAGRSNAAFHNAQPFWLIGHGRAARQGLEGCTACHTQTDCAQCHSAASGWRISPHGNGPPSTRVEEASRFTCLRCHRSGDLERRP